MKKKIVSLLLAAGLCLSIAACSGGNSGPLSSIEGASADQLSAIQDVLNECGIAVQACKAVENESTGSNLEGAITDALMEVYLPYTVTDDAGNTYRMVLNKEDYTVFSIVDESTNDFVYGGLEGLFSTEE